MMANCWVCGKMKEATQNQLFDLGWGGASGDVNGMRYKFEVCPKHRTPKIVVSIVGSVGKGTVVRRQSDGEYEFG